MDRETLKRLMIDDAFEALPADVGALLTAYTDGHPTEAAELSRWRQVTELAAQLADSPRTETLPPFPRREFATVNLRRVALVAGALAAAVLLGFNLNAWRSPASQTQPLAAVAPPASVAEAKPFTGVQDFWSSRRLLATTLNQPEPSQSQTHWMLFPDNPKIGGVR
jgi:hypothetical protein